MKIAVTGVGGGVGQSVLKSMAGTAYEAIGLDGELLGTGLYMTDTSYLIPYAKSPDFIPALLQICEKEKVSLLFPGLDAELMPLSLHREAFSEIGTTLVVSRPDIITISDDKQATYDELTKVGVNVPFTCKAEGFEPDSASFPLIVKPRVGGARSKNVFLARTRIEYDLITEKLGDSISEYIVMEYIEGDEYTCGTINLGDECKGVIVMRRVLRAGDTYKCFVETNETIRSTVEKCMNAIKPFGACNVQLRLRDGVPYIFEINARCSGTTAARTLSGFNEPLMIADYLLKGIEPSFQIKEQTILRYWKELVVENEDIEQLAKDRVRSANDKAIQQG